MKLCDLERMGDHAVNIAKDDSVKGIKRIRYENDSECGLKKVRN